MTMEKKVYIAPAIELFEFETEGCLLNGSVVVGVAKDKNTQQVIEVDAGGALTNKREPGNPWSSSPWE